MSTRPLLFRVLFLILPLTVLPALVQQADHMGPIHSECSVPLRGHTLAPLLAGRTVVSLIVEDHFTHYNVRVAIGNPARNYTLLLDTGTSKFFVGKTYANTSSSLNTSQPIRQNYTDGTWLTGLQFFDTVKLGCVPLNQSIGAATTSGGYGKGQGYEGVLGMGPTNLTDKMESPIPTITDNLVTQNITPSRTVGFSFRPSNDSKQFGEVTFGGIDQSHFVGPLVYVPITKTYPANRSVGINASIFYNNVPLLSNGVGTIDIGETTLKLADDIFRSYVAAAGIVMEKDSDYPSISKKGYEQLQPLVFVIGNSSFALTRDGQRFPPSTLRTRFHTNPRNVIIPIRSTNNSSGNGSDFVLGITWLRRFYHVYDPDNDRIGVANTSYTDAVVN